MSWNHHDKFVFRQPSRDRDCGWRCLYYCIPSQNNYELFLEQFKPFAPKIHGIFWKQITSILDYYEVKYKFTVPREDGLFLIWSGHGGGHYFIYDEGMKLDSLAWQPISISCQELIETLECQEYENSFQCLKIVK